MYARVGTAQIPSYNSDDGARRVREIVVPILKEQKGFKNLFVLANRETGKLYSINFWESEADLKAFAESKTAQKLTERMREAGGGALDWENFEVVVVA